MDQANTQPIVSEKNESYNEMKNEQNIAKWVTKLPNTCAGRD